MQRLGGLLEDGDVKVALSLFGLLQLGVNSIDETMDTSSNDGRVALSSRGLVSVTRVQDIGCKDASDTS